MSRSIITVLWSVCFIIAPLQANTINIPADYATIQAGINASSDSDTVLVWPGTYVENINFNGHNIVLGSLFLTTSDTSYISQTIIDGDSAGTVVTFNNGEDSTAVITGFTITHGYTDTNGAGILCESSNPTISYNVITENKGGIVQFRSKGGGISCFNSNSRIIYNTISHNIANAGGAIYVFEDAPLISNNLISDNYSEQSGGGIFSLTGDNTFIISQNTILNNIAGDDGGGIDCVASGMIRDNYIAGNISIAPWDGGGGVIIGSGDVTGNVIVNNTTSGRGGGLWYGANGIVANNIFARNSAYKGGGVLIGSEPLFLNNTIYDNTAYSSAGGIFAFGPYNMEFKNSIIWNNAPDQVAPNETANPIANYCDISGGYTGTGNIDCNPLFCNPDENDFHLADISCCLGAGEGGADIGALGIGCYASQYLLGDVNMYSGTWPPAAIGADVTYLVNYFRGTPAHACLLDGFWCSADVNGDCAVIGSDVTRLVNYFRGISALQWCPEHPPAWQTITDLPVDPPEGWPNCEE